MKIRSVVFT